MNRFSNIYFFIYANSWYLHLQNADVVVVISLGKGRKLFGFGSILADIAGSLHNIGIVYDYKGDYDEALVYYQKALKIFSRVFQNDLSHPDIRMTIENIDICNKRKGI